MSIIALSQKYSVLSAIYAEFLFSISYNSIYCLYSNNLLDSLWFSCGMGSCLCWESLANQLFNTQISFLSQSIACLFCYYIELYSFLVFHICLLLIHSFTKFVYSPLVQLPWYKNNSFLNLFVHSAFLRIFCIWKLPNFHFYRSLTL